MQPFPVQEHGSTRERPIGWWKGGAGSLGVVLVMAALLAACGGGTPKAAAVSPSTSTTAGGSGTSTATAAQLQAFRTCLSQHGVTLPTFTPRTTVPGQTPPSTGTGTGSGSGSGSRTGFAGGGGGGLSAVFASPADQAAVTACQSTLPAGYVAQQQARANQRSAFDSCMADHGVTVPTATAGSPPTTLDPTGAAYQICSPLLPARPAGTAPSSTTTSTVS